METLRNNQIEPVRSEVRRRPLKGASLILSELRSTEDFVDHPAFLSLYRLITLGERVPFEQAVESMTPFEQMVVNTTRLNPHTQLTQENDIQATGLLVIQERKIGHVSILAPEEVSEYQLAPEHFIVGFLQFPQEDYINLLEYKKSAERRFSEQEEEATNKLQLMERKGVLGEIISKLRNTLIHIDPIVIHVGHGMYSTFDQAGKNLIDRHSESDGSKLFAKFANSPVEAWSPEDKVFVYCASLLLESGRQSRLEEFNGFQLTIDSLNSFFRKKVELYAQQLGQVVPVDWDLMSLEEKAQFISKQNTRITSESRRYRYINGLTLSKEERIIEGAHVSENEQIRRDLKKRIQDIFGFEDITGETDREFWQRVTRQVIKKELVIRSTQENIDLQNGELSPLTLLLWAVVNAACEGTSSDIAMSSFFRDISKVSRGNPLDLEKNDFYCCVVPSDRMQKYHTSEQLVEPLRLIAARMQFNRWHFIPGNLPNEEVPLDRDWFYPPAIPDIATESDHHHGGHVEARVHHSIRYPSPLVVGGKEYKGAYDIRLMRQSGKGYDEVDLEICKEYVEAMGMILLTVVDEVENNNAPVIIDAFTTQWYRNQNWKFYSEIGNPTMNKNQIDTKVL